jgi:MipA family protein
MGPRNGNSLKMQYLPQLTALLAASLLCQAASADSGCTTPSEDCVEVGEFDIAISVGAGTRTNPVHGNGDIPLVAIPQISWYGKRFFIENLEGGVTLHEDETHLVNLIATPGYDRVFFYSNDLQNIFVSLSGGPIIPGDTVQRVPVSGRHTTYLAGPEWMFHYGKITGQINALYEVTGRHGGSEVRAALAGPLIDTRTQLIASGGFTWKSSELVDYYYGLEGVYEPGSVVNPFVKLTLMHPLSPRMAVNAFAHYEHLGESIADSPIIADPGSLTVFVGLLFKIL